MSLNNIRSTLAGSLLVMILLVGLMGMGLLQGCSGGLGPLKQLPQVKEADSVLERKQALELYHEAWQVVFTEYVDPTFNGQNWYRWKDRYNDKIQTKDDAYLAIRTMLTSLNDVYSRFLDPKRAQDQNMHIDSRLFGVGIQIAEKDGQIVVISPLEDSPAAKAGIRPLDRIEQINGTPAMNLTVDEVAERIRGPEGTAVTLTILRAQKQFDVRLVREEIVIKTVFGKPVSDEIGYIRLSSFISQDASKEMREKLLTQRNTKAMIIDLRGNNGGLLPNALEISDMFMNTGQIVSIVDRHNKRRPFMANPAAIYDKPLVVLIDEGSASASEIMGGALKDNERATLIGTRTFGKGMVQKINYLQDGSELNLTISKYYTPAGHDIDKKGIEPDIKVEMSISDLENNRDPQKDAAIRYLRKQILAKAS